MKANFQYLKDLKTVSEFAYREDINFPNRRSMEDCKAEPYLRF